MTDALQVLESDDLFVSEAVVDDTIDFDRYLRKPAGTSDQGHRED